MTAECAGPVVIFASTTAPPLRRLQPHWLALQVAAAAAAIREFADIVAGRWAVPRLLFGGPDEPEEPPPEGAGGLEYWDDPCFWMLMMH